MGKESEDDGQDASKAFKEAFGNRLRAAREAHQPKLTQEALGRQIAAQKAKISQWESGTHSPKLDALAALCDVLGCSSDYLLGRAFSGYSAAALAEAKAFDALSPEDQRKWRALRSTMFAVA